ncbi:MAG: glycoside hydrolase [Mucilaginibacter sp.]|nr:glycoside hydrolase [Mucilaginibacter sp.]
MKLKTILFLIIGCASGLVKAQAPDYKTRIDLLDKAINKKLRNTKNDLYLETVDSTKNPNPHSWLWPLCALVQAANEMEVLEPKKNYMGPVIAAIDQYYSDKPPIPGYQDYVTKERVSSRFYDDNQWVAIACLDAYNRNHRKKYLSMADTIYRFMMGGLDTVAGGGFYWKEGDRRTKNTCSNGPGILVALQLYKITHKAAYLNTAMSVYKWTNEHLQSPEGIYYDNIKLPALTIGKAFYTYNTGTMLQSNVLLYQITKDRKYLQEAQRIAAAGKAQFYKNGRLPNGQYWFNAVMLRGYQDLYQIDRNKAWIDFFHEDGDAIWNTERDADNLVGAKPPKRLIDQAAMIEIYARLQQIKNLK